MYKQFFQPILLFFLFFSASFYHSFCIATDLGNLGKIERYTTKQSAKIEIKIEFVNQEVQYPFRIHFALYNIPKQDEISISKTATYYKHIVSKNVGRWKSDFQVLHLWQNVEFDVGKVLSGEYIFMIIKSILKEHGILTKTYEDISKEKNEIKFKLIGNKKHTLKIKYSIHEGKIIDSHFETSNL